MCKMIENTIDVFSNDFSREVYNTKYKYGNEDICGTRKRVARAVAQAELECDKEKYATIFEQLLADFKFIPGGRILSNAGTGLSGTTFFNCFVSGFVGEDKDSLTSILDEIKRQALVLKSEGGYGFCVDVLRPRGAFIRGIGSESPGPVKMLDMWDTTSNVITEGSGKKSENKKAKSGIRKGAMLVTMSCWHPAIEEFITAKQVPGRLTKFNMSVLITDAFMEAVRNHSEWSLEFPDIDSDMVTEYGTVRDAYKKTWDGNLAAWKNAGYPVRTYKKYEDACELWDIIIGSTYSRNEPGILFIDRINRMNNMRYCEYISAANPCAEEPMPIGGACLLGNINVTRFVKFDENGNAVGWDYDALGDTIHMAVRFMDNVNDVSYAPLDIQNESIRQKRRIGLGIMGYASALMMMKVQYGSQKCVELTEELMRFFTNSAYAASANLAAERGAFPMYDKEKYLKSEFLKVLDKDTIDVIKKYGMRNSHVTTIAPTGNTSSLANNVSGGLEPIFRPIFTRTMTVDNWPSYIQKPIRVDFANREFELEPNDEATYAENGKWEWMREGDENMLRAMFVENGKETIFKYDQNRGLTRESVVMDYGVAWLHSRGEYDQNADYSKDVSNLTVAEHIAVMDVFAKYIDAGISKTINIPNDYSFEDFKGVYDMMYDSGHIKGGTTYRAGTMASVLSEVSVSPQLLSIKIQRTKAPKRPRVLECDIHHLTIGGEKWLVFIGLYGEERDPYEVFAFKRNGIQISPKITAGTLVKTKLRNHQTRYDLDLGTVVIEDICKHFKTGEESALTRMISTSLRHGADMDYIYDQLMKAEGSVISFSKAVARALKKYVKTMHDTTCPECGTENAVVFTEGCVKCTSCSWSKCL